MASLLGTDCTVNLYWSLWLGYILPSNRFFIMAKPCHYCGLEGHSTLTCYARPKNRVLHRTAIKRIGKGGQKWLRTRAEYFRQNSGPYFCYYCGELLALSEVELDHKLSRSRHPELRYELSNLVPSCHRDNMLKGSMSADQYIEKFYNNSGS